jgi:hypothetical protein
MANPYVRDGGLSRGRGSSGDQKLGLLFLQEVTGVATGTYRITPSDCTRHPGTACRSVVTAAITTPSRSSRAE